MQFTVNPRRQISGEFVLPGDKSISHRSIIFSALADGKSEIRGLLEGEDVLATIAAFRAMGVRIERHDAGHYSVQGVGIDGLQAPVEPLDMGNSGTAMRLLSGVLAAQPWASTLVGDESLTKRPMGRVITPLSAMGAQIDAAEGKPPLHIQGKQPLKGIHYPLPMASAQVKSAVLLAGLYGDGETTVIEPAPTRDHTERMLQGFGYSVTVNGREIGLTGGGRLQAQTIDVPSDLSSAAFFIVAGLLAESGALCLRGVGMNPTRNGLLPVLQRMGGDIQIDNERVIGGEPVADLLVKPSELQGCVIAGDDIALAVDEVPILAVAAASATGVTEIRDASELRVKESDRIRSVVMGLQALKAKVEEKLDGMIIHGGKALSGGRIQTFYDHRIAMAFSMASLLADAPIVIDGAEHVATSFPNFVDLANHAGLDVQVSDE